MKNQDLSLVTTKGGDKGETTLYSGERYVKNALIFEALGDIDELNSYLGVVKIKLNDYKPKGIFKEYTMIDIVEEIQIKIMVVSSIIATTPGTKLYKKLNTITEEDIALIEKNELHFLENTIIAEEFVVPGNENNCSPHIDYARALTRRCERKIVSLIRDNYRLDLINSQKYFNRISDLLFIFARYLEQN